MLDIWACVVGNLGLSYVYVKSVASLTFKTLFLKAQTHLFILFILSRSSGFMLIVSKTSIWKPSFSYKNDSRRV